jgi:hypothetical protein
MTRSILTRTAAVALAISALAAPAAFARPDVTPAARNAGTKGFATRPVIDRNPTSPSSLVPVAPADRGIDWATIAIGIAGGLLAVGAIAGIAGHAGHAHIGREFTPAPGGVGLPADAPGGRVETVRLPLSTVVQPGSRRFRGVPYPPS